MERDKPEVHPNWTTSLVRVTLPLPEGAEPEEWITLDFNETEEHRFFDCPNYSACGSYAAGLQWISWTCSLCDQFRIKL